MKKIIAGCRHMPNGCWAWIGAKTRGYGSINVRGRGTVFAHRLSFELFVGPIQDGAFICHKCDNPQCVNPAHLFSGTPLENMQDMVSKGRYGVRALPNGEAHHKTKLTKIEVAEIRASNDPRKALAKHYGVSESTIGNIRRRRTWIHA